MNILGLSAFYHDSAAVVVKDGQLIAAAQEERFTRKKHDARFPEEAIRYCLREAGVPLTSFDYIVFYDKPYLKFERLIETYLSFAPRGVRSFTTAMPIWIKEKLFLKDLLRKRLLAIIVQDGHRTLPPPFFRNITSRTLPMRFPHLLLSGLPFFASMVSGNGLRLRHGQAQGVHSCPSGRFHFPIRWDFCTLPLLTMLDLRSTRESNKVMGMAPYGRPVYVKKIYYNLIDLKSDGTFRLNMDFDYCTGFTMTNQKFNILFEGPPWMLIPA
jgi:carbamoyltransferase